MGQSRFNRLRPLTVLCDILIASDYLPFVVIYKNSISGNSYRFIV